MNKNISFSKEILAKRLQFSLQNGKIVKNLPAAGVGNGA